MTSPSAALAELPAGFAAPGPATQVVFRCALEALSRPGRRIVLPEAACASLAPPPPLGRAMAALLLTLLDAEVTLWLAPSLDQPLVRAWLGFHTGVAMAARADDARFVAAAAHEVDAALWQRLGRGSDEVPHDGATLLVELSAAGAGAAHLVLTGPGIATEQPLDAPGIARGVWQQRQDEHRLYPLGIDLLLCDGAAVAGLPRSTRVALQG